MPTSIPFDHPSLVLGNIVNPVLLNKLKRIGVLQAQVESTQGKMNSYISLKRSLGMTITELIDMNVDVSALVEKIKDTDAAIIKAATDYTTTRLANETSIQEIKEQIGELESDDSIESPIDYNRTELRKMPLSANSLKLDAQYFSYDENNEENPLSTVSSIENYIKDSTASLGARASSDLGNAASAQINLQRKNHSISGTLVITASCTHKNAVLLAPLILDIDKGISAWNSLNPGNKINTGDPAVVQELADQEEDDTQTAIPILSGATYGSSFVGMVHVLKKDSTGNGPSMTSVAAGLQERFKIGSWFEESSGGFGIDTSFSDEIKNLLSTQKITSHITVVVMGSIPSIKSNQVEMGVKTFADFDPAKMTANLASLANATSAETSTVDQAATTARTGAKVLAMQGSTIQNVMMGLGKIDQGANKTMDINSMMNAFEDYLQDVKSGDSGVPVNFYVKNISQRQLAQMWLEKYYPGKDSPAAVKDEKPAASGITKDE